MSDGALSVSLPAQAQSHGDLKGAWRSRLRTWTMVFALFAIWGVFQWATDGSFLEPRNLSNLFRQMAVTGVLATGMVLVIVAGHIDLSVGSAAAVIGALLSILTTNYGWDPTLAFLAALGAGALIGLAQGFLTSYQRIPAFIVTLGGMMALRGMSMGVTEGITIPLGENWIQTMGSAYFPTSWGYGLAIIVSGWFAWTKIRSSNMRKNYGLPTPSSWALMGQLGAVGALVFAFVVLMNAYQGIPVPVLVMLGLTFAFHGVATRTVFGRHVYAIGGSIEAARLSGINVRSRILWVFVFMGALTAVAATVLTARVGSASPDAGQLLELDAIAACVIGGTSLMGGRGSVLGAILGALVMESLNNGMSLANMEAFWQYVVKGSVLVLAVWVDVLSQGKTTR